MNDTETASSTEGHYVRIMVDMSLTPQEKMAALLEEYAAEVIAEYGEAEWVRRVAAALAVKMPEFE